MIVRSEWINKNCTIHGMKKKLNEAFFKLNQDNEIKKNHVGFIACDNTNRPYM